MRIPSRQIATAVRVNDYGMRVAHGSLQLQHRRAVGSITGGIERVQVWNISNFELRYMTQDNTHLGQIFRGQALHD